MFLVLGYLQRGQCEIAASVLKLNQSLSPRISDEPLDVGRSSYGWNNEVPKKQCIVCWTPTRFRLLAYMRGDH